MSLPIIVATSITMLATHFTLRYFQGGQVTKSALSKDLTGNVYIVTGANIGIGYETAKQLYAQNGTVFLLCRSRDKAEEAMKSIRKTHPKSEGELVFIPLDLLDLDAVKSAAQELIAELQRRNKKITALINNAGIMHHPHATTKQGFEIQFGTNHLAHFVLTILLLPHIEENGRVVNVSSLVHTGGSQRIRFENLRTDAKDQGVFDLYNQSKLANVLFTKALDRRLRAQDSRISVVSLHPGVVRTNLMRHHNPLFRVVLVPFNTIFFKSAKSGAQTTLHCTLADEVTSGSYYADCRELPSVKTSYEVDFQDKLWDLSKEWTGIEADEIVGQL